MAIRDLPPVRPLPKQHGEAGIFQISEAQGRDSLLELVKTIRDNLDYKNANAAIKIGLKPATKYLAKELAAALPRAKQQTNVLRPPGTTARSVKARLGVPPARWRQAKVPIGRVVVVGPGYVYNFFKGTGLRRRALISGARKRGLWRDFKRGVGGWGRGGSTGMMPKIFDIETFLATHKPIAIGIMVRTFNQMVDSAGFRRKATLKAPPEGVDL